MDLGGVYGKMKYISKVTGWTVLVELGFFFLDIITDLKQIHDLYHSGQHFLGGLMLFVYSASMTMLVAELTKLYSEVVETLKKGYFTDEFLHMMNLEKGFESALSLMASAYISRFAITDAVSLASNVFNILISSLSLALFLQRRVILTKLFGRYVSV